MSFPIAQVIPPCFCLYPAFSLPLPTSASTAPRLDQLAQIVPGSRRRSSVQGNIHLPRDYYLLYPSPRLAHCCNLRTPLLSTTRLSTTTYHSLADYTPITRQLLANMSNYSQQQYGAPSRPAFSALQSSNTPAAGYASTSTSSIASRSSTQSAPPVSQSTSPQNHQYFGSLNQQSQQAQQQPRLQAQRHPSFEYQPNRNGAGQTAAETTNYLNQAALLAEAAKRAQMACVMRDLDGMEL